MGKKSFFVFSSFLIFFLSFLLSYSQGETWNEWANREYKKWREGVSKELHKDLRQKEINNQIEVGGQPYLDARKVIEGIEGVPPFDQHEVGEKFDREEATDDMKETFSDWQAQMAIERARVFCEKEREGYAYELCIKHVEILRVSRPNVSMMEYTIDKMREEAGVLWGKMNEECREIEKQFEKDYENIINGIRRCDFTNAKYHNSMMIYKLSRRCPRSTLNIRASEEFPEWIKDREEDLKEELKKTDTAMKEGKKNAEFCLPWDLPDEIRNSKILKDCKPLLVDELKQLSENTKRRELGFNAFKNKRVSAIDDGNSSLRECRALNDSLNALNKLDPKPYETCANSMLLQEHSTDPVDYLKKTIQAEIKDLDERWRIINSILAQTNSVILKCDWNSLDRMKTDALRALPKENCIRNYPGWAKARDMIYDLDRKKQIRLGEVQGFRDKLKSQLMLTEGYLRTRGGRTQDWQKTWDANAVKHYNYEKGVLDGHVREAHNQGYADCVRDLIAHANALPPKIAAQDNVDNRKVKTQLYEKCKNMRKGYQDLNCATGPRKNYSGCFEAPVGCYGYVISDALPDFSTPSRANCGIAVLEGYIACLEQCNNRLLNREPKFNVGVCGWDCRTRALERINQCKQGK